MCSDELCVVNDRIGLTLCIASVMPVMPGVPVVYCWDVVHIYGLCEMPYGAFFMCIGMLFHLLSILLHFESFVAVNIIFLYVFLHFSCCQAVPVDAGDAGCGRLVPVGAGKCRLVPFCAGICWWVMRRCFLIGFSCLGWFSHRGYLGDLYWSFWCNVVGTFFCRRHCDL